VWPQGKDRKMEKKETWKDSEGKRNKEQGENGEKKRGKKEQQKKGKNKWNLSPISILDLGGEKGAAHWNKIPSERVPIKRIPLEQIPVKTKTQRKQIPSEWKSSIKLVE